MVFERHGALFVNRETDTGIYPLLRKEYDEKSVYYWSLEPRFSIIHTLLVPVCSRIAK